MQEAVTIRKVLAGSHVSAVSIAVLLVWGFESLFRVAYAIVGTVIFQIPYLVFELGFSEKFSLIVTLYYCSAALFSFTAAWGLSRWVYEEGPIRGLVNFGITARRRSRD